MKHFDFAIVGAGIVGLAMARELRLRYPGKSIAVFEKENGLAKHASGRNSGVLHSGIYYPPDSLKARVCAAGRKEMADYCGEHKLPIVRAGKVILPVREGDDAQLRVLQDRAEKNGVSAELLDETQLREIEPEAKSISGKALFVPDAYVVDPKAIVHHLGETLQAAGVQIHLNCRIQSIQPEQSRILIRSETISFGHLINAAGAYADKIAQKFGIARHYSILPFKGIYYRLSSASGIEVRHLIYAVPDLRVPFLGVHYAKSISGEIFLGPTVIPAFGRENYSLFSGLSLFDTGSILFRIAQQYTDNRSFRTLVHREGKRFLRRHFASAVQALTPRVRPEHLISCDKVGIRAQLLDTQKRELVMDFVVERGKNSTHILNAVSPAFTSSFAFAKLVLDQYL